MLNRSVTKSGSRRSLQAWLYVVITCALILPRLVLADVCTPEGQRCILSGDIAQWNTHSGFKTQRVWGLKELEPAFTHMGGMYQAKRLLDKLNSGKRIITVAIGSSYVHTYAGCWQTSIKALYDLGIQPNPHLYPQLGQSDKCVYPGPGYMEGFMETLNHTWPNFNHIFLNTGKNGVSLWHLAEASCLSANMPEEVDLVMLDPLTNFAEPFTAEKLMRSFLGSKSEPVVLLVSNTRNCEQMQPLDPKMTEDQAFWACHRDCLHDHVQSACDSLGPEPYTPAFHSHMDELVRPYQSMAIHYDVPHIDLHRVMRDSFLGTSLHQHLNITKWNLLSRFYMDWVHPQREDLGTLLLADLLVYWLYKSQQLLATMPPAVRDSLSYRMPPVLHEHAKRLYRSRCFGVSFQQVMATAQQAVGSGSQEAQQALQQLNNLTEDFFGSMANEGGPQGMHAMPALHVVEQRGFEVQGYYKTASGMKFKPGYMAHTAGAILEFELSTEFSNSPTIPSPEVVITYTSSYDGWGIATVACISGCACSEVTIDADSGGKKSSLMETREVPASQHPNCRMRVQVSDRTTSGGHKFKVSAVMVRLLVPPS